MNIPNFQKSKQKISKKRGGEYQKSKVGISKKRGGDFRKVRIRFLKSEVEISEKRGGYWAFFLRKFAAFIQNVYFCRGIGRGYRKRI